MTPLKNKVALLVHSCDRYELLFRGFEYFFQKNWDFDIPCTYYFATEEISAEVKNFVNIKSGPGQWSDRLVRLLDQIEEEYVLYFQEDMWLNKPVSKSFFTDLFDIATKNAWKQVKLSSSEVFKTKETNLFIEGFNIAVLKNEESGFLMSHQVTLWDKVFLRQQLMPNEHPWRNERKGTKRLRKLNPEIHHIDYFAENGKPAINNNQASVNRSEYRSISVNATLNESVLPFIEEMESDQNLSGYTSKLRHHYLNKITHDGKPKPLKRNIFKRLKDWIRQK